MKEKIGIITQLNLDNVNYGNRLQSFALNYYLNQNFTEFETESLIFSIYDKTHITKRFFYIVLKRELSKIKKYLKKQIEKKQYDFSKRLKLCNNFTEKYTKLSKEKMDVETMKDNYTPKQGIIVEGIYGSILFKGVTNELELKKRYKDLMKIYHPDNIAGDDTAVQEINKEYDLLKTEFRARY